jgi:hypothetical protein
MDLGRVHVQRHTKPTPCPRATEKAYRTLMVGLSHVVNPSSTLWESGTDGVPVQVVLADE